MNEDENLNGYEDDEEEDYLTVEDYQREIKRLMKLRKQFSPLSDEYADYTELIGRETENLRNMQAAENEYAQAETARRNKHTAALAAAGSTLGNFAGQVVTSLINRKNVMTVVGYESDGGIVNSAAKKFVR